MNLLIKNARRVLRDNELETVDVLIKDTRIIEIGQICPLIDNVFDAQGALVTAGFIDVHVHLREPGFEAKETIATGTLAAAHGGYTTICAMPNTNPAPDTVDKLKKVNEIIKKDALIRVFPYAPITFGLKTDSLTDFKGLQENGAFAFTNDGVGVQSGNTMYEAMKYAKEINAIVVAHAEDEGLKYGGVMHDGIQSKRLNLPGIPSICESSQVARDLLMAEASGVHYHVCHVSAKETVRIIREAKRAGIDVTCEVTPHNLLLCDTDILTADPNFKMNPPLRSKEDREALIEGLCDGTIDLIVTDHAPHTVEEKQRGMLEAPFGIVGLETAFEVLYTKLVKTGILTLEKLLNVMSASPAKLFGLEEGKVEVGAIADLTLIDIDRETTIDAQRFLSKSSNSPFIGWEVYGETVMTIVDGKIVWKRG
ncbi:MAG: dihydroorotase [Erysipelotrichaceae bacterium]